MAKRTNPDGAEAIAEQAYTIYRGMCRSTAPAHWEQLTMRERGAFVWVARFAMLNCNGQSTIAGESK